MMKKRFSYISALLLLTITITYGQNSLTDPGRSAEEQAAYENSIPVNPAKVAVDANVDPKMDPGLTQAGPTNWKPLDIPTDEKKAPEIEKAQQNTEVTRKTHANRTQPEALPSQSKVVSLRDMKGPKTQPVAPKSGNMTNYRNLKGSKTQPEGEKPKR